MSQAKKRRGVLNDMDRRKQHSEAEWQSLISELQALKRKLHSKTEALLIISKDLDATQKERDQFKLMAEKLRVRCQAYKRQFSDYPLTHDQATLLQMLRDTRNQKIAHQKQCESLQQKLNEALGDVKLLRERFARQRIGDEGIGPRHFPAHEREELVEQLETSKQQAEHFRQEFDIASDQITELRAEKDDFRLKSDRLNNELNFMLNGDKKRIIDIDALCMENKYLQERVKQCQEEKNSLHAQLSKLKGVLNSRKSANTDIIPGKMRNSGLVISPRQVKEILMNRSSLPTSAETVSDLQSIAAALLETINDKNLALHHLRNTNKILGNRVAELEKKLRTFEVGGLWNMNDESRPKTSSPKVFVESTADINEEFFSTLGSRLSKLTDVCSKSFQEYSKLVSLTPESSGSTSDVTRDDDATGFSNNATANGAIADGATTPDDTVHAIAATANSNTSNINEADESISSDIFHEATANVAGFSNDATINNATANMKTSHDAIVADINATADSAIANVNGGEGDSFGDDISHDARESVTGASGDATFNNAVGHEVTSHDATIDDIDATVTVGSTGIISGEAGKNIPANASRDATGDTACNVSKATSNDATDANNKATELDSTVRGSTDVPVKNTFEENNIDSHDCTNITKNDVINKSNDD